MAGATVGRLTCALPKHGRVLHLDRPVYRIYPGDELQSVETGEIVRVLGWHNGDRMMVNVRRGHDAYWQPAGTEWQLI